MHKKVYCMYDTSAISGRIKQVAKLRGVTMRTMLSDLNMGINAISQFAKGSEMSVISFVRIADYLKCSTDYLLGRSDDMELRPGKHQKL